MSLINQVLNELESRGANSSLGGDAIRAIPPRKQSHLLRYVILALVLLIMLAAAQWYLWRTEKPLPDRSSAVIALPTVSVSAVAASTTGVSGVPDDSLSNVSLHGKHLIEVGGKEAQAEYPEETKKNQHKSRRVAEQVPLAEVVEADKPAYKPKEKKNTRQKSHRTTEQVAEDLPTENPVGLQLKQISPEQHVENEFSKANLALQEGRSNDALKGYEGVLRLDPHHHASRRALVGVLVSLKRNGDAESVLQDGLKLDPHEASFAMLLARLQVARDAVPLALETLQATLPYAEARADYQAFVAALLQRQNRHDEAVAHYQTALKLAPNNGIWLMGMGISLQALRRNEDARAAYQRALASGSLNAQLQAFVQQKLKEL